MDGGVAHQFQSHRRAAGFCRRGEHRPHAEVVHSDRRLDLLGTVRGQADQAILAHHPPGHRYAHIILADVHPVGFHGGDQVRPVIEDQKRPVLGADLTEAPADVHELGVPGVLHAELDQVHAGAQHRVQEGVRPRVADQVQTGQVKSLTTRVHLGKSGMTPTLGSPEALTNQQRRFDVAVVGGGAIGLAIAWRAARRGLKVAVLERGRTGGGASWVAAGMLAPVTEARLTEVPLLELGVASAALYPAFVEDLQLQSGIDPGYERYGTLVIARDGDEAEALERELEVHQRLGLVTSRLRPSQARRLEPALAPAIRLALEVREDHAIDPRRLTEALDAGARAVGVEILTGTEATQIHREGDAVCGVGLSDGSQVEANTVVIAAGVWADALAGLPDGDRVPVHPVKGQVIRLRDPAGPGLLRRVLRTGGAYLVPRGDGRYVLGATMEERGFDTTVTAGAVFELLRDVGEVLPGISELMIDEVIAGLRPATPDGLPAIGPGGVPGLHWAVGHFRNGILLAPITAEIVVAGLLGEPPPEIAAGFLPSRFGTVPASV